MTFECTHWSEWIQTCNNFKLSINKIRAIIGWNQTSQTAEKKFRMKGSALLQKQVIRAQKENVKASAYPKPATLHSHTQKHPSSRLHPSLPPYHVDFNSTEPDGHKILLWIFSTALYWSTSFSLTSNFRRDSCLQLEQYCSVAGLGLHTGWDPHIHSSIRT